MVHLAAHERVALGRSPASLSHEPVGLDDTPTRREYERHRQIRRGPVDDTGRVRHGYLATRTCRDVDGVIADAVVGDDEQVRQTVEHGVIDRLVLGGQGSRPPGDRCVDPSRSSLRRPPRRLHARSPSRGRRASKGPSRRLPIHLSTPGHTLVSARETPLRVLNGVPMIVAMLGSRSLLGLPVAAAAPTSSGVSKLAVRRC